MFPGPLLGGFRPSFFFSPGSGCTVPTGVPASSWFQVFFPCARLHAPDDPPAIVPRSFPFPSLPPSNSPGLVSHRCLATVFSSPGPVLPSLDVQEPPPPYSGDNAFPLFFSADLVHHFFPIPLPSNETRAGLTTPGFSPTIHQQRSLQRLIPRRYHYLWPSVS